MAKILLVEDDPSNAKLVSRRLVRLGFTVVNADCRADAVQMAKSEMPDVILMDIMLLPETEGGFDATREIKADDSTKHIPIIALSASEDFRPRAVQAGCCDLMLKPIDFVQVEARIKEMLGSNAGN